MKALCLLVVVIAGVASALTNAYRVDPQTAAMSGKVKYDLGVGQYVVCT